MPRAADSRAPRCAAHRAVANDYCYVIIQPQVWPALARIAGRPELADDPAYATPEARIKHLDEVFGMIEQWTMRHTKHEVMRTLMEADVPCGPILSMKDLIEDPRARHGAG